MAIEAFDLFFIARCGVLSSLDWTWWPALVADWIQLHNNRGDLSLKIIFSCYSWFLKIGPQLHWIFYEYRNSGIASLPTHLYTATVQGKTTPFDVWVALLSMKPSLVIPFPGKNYTFQFQPILPFKPRAQESKNVNSKVCPTISTLCLTHWCPNITLPRIFLLSVNDI